MKRLVAGVVLFAFGAIFALVGWAMKPSSIPDERIAVGEIVAVSETRTSKGGTTYRARSVFEVDGQRYVSVDRIGTNEPIGEGQSVEVRYSATDPDINERVGSGVGWFWLLFFGTGVVCVLSGLFLVGRSLLSGAGLVAAGGLAIGASRREVAPPVAPPPGPASGSAWTPAPGAEAPPQPQPAANWYPDPDNSGGLRYWDGSGWTEHRHEAGRST